MNKDDEYSSFMLRFRRMPRDDQSTWVVFVQAIQTGQLMCFPRLEGLIDFLQSRFGSDVELESVDQPTAPDTGKIEPCSENLPSES